MRWATCRGSRNSRAPACSTGGCRARAGDDRFALTRRNAAELRVPGPAGRDGGCAPAQARGRTPCFCRARSLASGQSRETRRACGLVDAEELRMGSMSIWHWILVLAVGLLLFGGRGKISELMGDFAKGIKSFKKGLTEEEKAETEPVKTDPKTIDHQPAPAPTATVTETRKAG